MLHFLVELLLHLRQLLRRQTAEVDYDALERVHRYGVAIAHSVDPFHPSPC